MGECVALVYFDCDLWLSIRGKYSKIRSCVNIRKGLSPLYFHPETTPQPTVKLAYLLFYLSS